MLVRKKSSPYLAPEQFANLMVLPWVHFGMLKAGELELEYLYSLAGIFNIVGALANRQRKREMEDAVSAAQTVVSRLLEDCRCPDQGEIQQIAQTLQASDRYLARQQKRDIAIAIAYVERCIETGRAKGIPKENKGGYGD